MSMPMICAAAERASSGVLASLIPPALPRPPTGTCALTATGPSCEHAAAASSGVRATRPGGIAMPSDERTSLAWYSRSFKSRLSVLAQRDPPVVAPHPVSPGYSKLVSPASVNPSPRPTTGRARRLQGDVAVPLRAAAPLLAHRDPQGADQLAASAAGLDHVIDVSTLGSDVRVGEALGVV